MKILHIIDRLVIGGAEILLKNTLQELSGKFPDIENHVVTIYSGGELETEIKKYAKYHNLNINKTNFLRKIFELKKYIKTNKIDLIHSHLSDATLIARLAIPSTVNLISTYHNIHYNPKSPSYSYKRILFEKLTYKPKYHTIFVSKEVERIVKYAVGITTNFTVLENFYNREFVPLYQLKKNPELRLVSIGNLKAVKNYPLAIEAIGKTNNNNISLDIYGEGNIKGDLIKSITNNNARVFLKGNAQITSSLLAQYDAFLMTSLNEGMPISVIEAMATGLPLILNDIPELRETAKDAAIYFNTNSQNSLTLILNKIANDKHVLKSLAEKSILNVQKYNPNHYINRLIELYQSVSKIDITKQVFHE